MAIRPLICIAVAAALLSGCASVSQAPLPPQSELFLDSAFGQPTEVIGADDLFTLSAPMRAYLHSQSFLRQVREEGLEKGLVHSLYKRGELQLEYDSTHTRNAAQTFEARRGNCLSLVIMTAAFARELHLSVRYQNVIVDESWSRQGKLYVASTHVNMGLGKFGERQQLTIDFLPSEDAARFHSYPLDEVEVVAMFMNNRAAEALSRERIDDAYWWARSAVAKFPASINAYNTLGVIYHHRGENAQAERVLRAALQREPENTIIMYNLAPLLALNGKTEESKAMAARLATLEPFPPYHFFNLGMKALEQGDFSKARDLFGREVKRAPYNHEFHFWLAMAHLQLGETMAARSEVRLALDNSTTRESSDLYSAKLNRLRDAYPRNGNF